MSFWCLQDQLTLFKPGGRLCPSHYCQLPWILEAIYTSVIKLGHSLKLVIYLKYVSRYYIQQGRNRKENLGATSAMVGGICPPPWWG